ncbi:MAG: sugar ABC transporter permease [Chloroflexota bacterium]
MSQLLSTEAVARAYVAPRAVVRARRGLVRGIGWLTFYAVLLAGSVVMVLPLVWMLSTASKPIWETEAPELRLIPSQFLLFENLQAAFRRIDLGRYFLNSIIVAVARTAGHLLLCSLAGYSFAKYTYRGRDMLFMAVLSTLMIPFFVVLIPLFVVVRNLGWLNTYYALIVPGLVSPFGIFLMRQFIMGIPSELIDAARIDGASEPGIFIRIVLPLSTPALSALAILTFLASWDDYVYPLTVISRKDLYTVPLGLAWFSSQYLTIWNELMAAALVAMLPVFIVFLLFQRYFVQGVVLSGLKG